MKTPRFVGAFFYFYKMNTNSFLHKIAQQITNDCSLNFTNIVIVLPNKRARLFLLEAFKSTSKATFFAPEIISIEDLIAQISKMNSLTSVEQLFEFYEVYKESNLLQPEYHNRRDLYNLYHILNHLNMFGKTYLPAAQKIIDSYSIF